MANGQRRLINGTILNFQKFFGSPVHAWGMLFFKKELLSFLKNWLGDLDSNQGYPGQSQVFYR